MRHRVFPSRGAPTVFFLCVLPDRPRVPCPPFRPDLQVVAIVESIGRIWGISTSILGVTVIAIGNSVGDYVADTAAARGADARMAVAACFGSPLLSSMLVRTPAPPLPPR
jgi:hypothetical protein